MLASKLTLEKYWKGFYSSATQLEDWMIYDLPVTTAGQHGHRLCMLQQYKSPSFRSYFSMRSLVAKNERRVFHLLMVDLRPTRTVLSWLLLPLLSNPA
jgi:hypothetical protein